MISCNIKSLTWYDYNHTHLAKFGYDKYLIISFWYASAVYQAINGLTMGILAQLPAFCAKIWTMAWPNLPEMLPTHTKKVLLGVIIVFMLIFFWQVPVFKEDSYKEKILIRHCSCAWSVHMSYSYVLLTNWPSRYKSSRWSYRSGTSPVAFSFYAWICEYTTFIWNPAISTGIPSSLGS